MQRKEVEENAVTANVVTLEGSLHAVLSNPSENERLKFTLNIGFVEYSTESFSYICGRVLSLSCRVLNKAQFCDSVEYSTYLCSHIEQLSGL